MEALRAGERAEADLSRRGRRGREVVAIALAGALALVAAPAAAQTGSFSRDEARRLRSGELVVRRESRQRGELRLVGGTSFQVINAPPDLVWRAMLDTNAYHHFVPATESSRLIRDGENQRTIEVVHAHGIVRARYFLGVTFDARTKSAQFRVDRTRPRDIREGWGFVVVRPYGARKCLVTFGVMVDVGTGLATGLVRPRVHHWMMQMPAELKRYVEGWGRSRYE